MSETPSNQPTDGGQPTGGAGDGATLTQADVDAQVQKIAAGIRADERRKVSEKFADYDDLKAKASGAKTLEDRLADLESTTATATQRAQRAEIAAEFGISTKRGEGDKPSDADLFLTATDEPTLRAQAERFAAHQGQAQSGTKVPREGRTPSQTKSKSSWSGVLADLDG